jgi:hypothetical protein
MSHQLTPAAEDLRKQIKELIPKTAKEDEIPTKDQGLIPKTAKEGQVTVLEDQGRKSYRGQLLEEKISRLIGEMNIGEVCESAKSGCCSSTY